MAGLGLAAVSPAAAAHRPAAVPAHIVLSAASGPPGTTIRVSGSGFAAGERVRIWLAGIAHTVARANRRGSFAGALVKMTSGTEPGTYRITGLGRRSGRRASATFAVHINWAQYGYGPARAGRNVYENALSPSAVPGLSQAWRFDTGNEVLSSPAVVNGRMYVGSQRSAVYALNAATGGRQWMFRTDGAVDSSPAVFGGKVYVGSEGNRMYALSAATGARRWMYRTGAAVFGSPTVRSFTRQRQAPVAALNAYTVPFIAATYTVPPRTVGEPKTAAPVRYIHRRAPVAALSAYIRSPSDPT